MDNIIKRIIDIDKQARRATQSAVSEKEEARRSIELQKQKVYDEYLEETKQETERLRIEFDKKSRKAYESSAAANKKEIERLDTLDAQYHKKWVQELYSKVIDA